MIAVTSRKFVVLPLLIGMLVVAGFGVVASFMMKSEAGTVANVPASIARDCSVNVSSELNTWIASVPNGQTLVFGGGCFRIDQTLNVTNRTNLIIDGGGATFKTNDPTGDGSSLATPSVAARSRSHWRISAGSNITIKNMTVVGANPSAGMGDSAYREALEAQHGFDVHGTDGIDIGNVTVTDVYGDFVYLGYHATAGWVDGARIHDSHFERNGRQAISVIAARNVRIDTNFISQIRRTTFDFEPNSELWGADNITLDHNTIGPGRVLMFSTGGQGPINRVTIASNQFNRAATMSFRGGTGHLKTLTIENNVQSTPYDSSQGTMIGMSNIDGLSFKNNTVLFNPKKSMYALNLASVTGIVATGNTLTNGVGVAKFSPDLPSQVMSMCGNRYAASGPFDKPIVCPTVPSPSPAPSTVTPPPVAPTSPSQAPPGSAPTGSKSTQPKPVTETNNVPAGSGSPRTATATAQTVIAAPVEAATALVEKSMDTTLPWSERLKAGAMGYGAYTLLVIFGLALMLGALQWYRHIRGRGLSAHDTTHAGAPLGIYHPENNVDLAAEDVPEEPVDK